MDKAHPAVTDDVSSSYWLQYTSLMAIILSFIIAAFVKPQAPKVTMPPTSVTLKESDRGTIGRALMKSLFKPSSGELIDESAAALSQFLEQHDVLLRVRVYAGPEARGWPSSRRFALALARAMSLEQRFTDEVAKGQIRISAVGSWAEADAAVTAAREAP